MVRKVLNRHIRDTHPQHAIIIPPRRRAPVFTPVEDCNLVQDNEEDKIVDSEAEEMEEGE